MNRGGIFPFVGLPSAFSVYSHHLPEGLNLVMISQKNINFKKLSVIHFLI